MCSEKYKQLFLPSVSTFGGGETTRNLTGRWQHLSTAYASSTQAEEMHLSTENSLPRVSPIRLPSCFLCSSCGFPGWCQRLAAVHSEAENEDIYFPQRLSHCEWGCPLVSKNKNTHPGWHFFPSGLLASKVKDKGVLFLSAAFYSLFKGVHFK